MRTFAPVIERLRGQWQQGCHDLHRQRGRSRDEATHCRRQIGWRPRRFARPQPGPGWAFRPALAGGRPVSSRALARRSRREARGRPGRPRVLWQPGADLRSGMRTKLQQGRRAAGHRQARPARSGSPAWHPRRRLPGGASRAWPAPPDGGPVRRAAGNPAAPRQAASSPPSARTRACQAGARRQATLSVRKLLPLPQHNSHRTQYLYLNSAVGHGRICETVQAVISSSPNTD